MEGHHGRSRMSVPQFGAWDGKTGEETNYSVVFSQARANRKKTKNDHYLGAKHSLGNERELLTKHQHHHGQHLQQHHDDDDDSSSMAFQSKKKEKKRQVTCLSCFLRR